MESHMREFIKVMKAASDTTRVKIIKMQQNKAMCVCEIQKAVGTAPSTASKHLKILEEAGLITSVRNQTERFCMQNNERKMKVL
jgi:ArsR family transcriptional regulator